ncbi:MAG TPA: 50S ribosomal protein L21 [Candidatus Dormibacteraeota bacterium]|nr:50S ribosomal protein L21 [Candidatus Dormibacteraeota bacterium]
MPSPSASLTAVIVSGGKQYRVATGDRILVDRLKAEPGSELTLDRVLLISDGSTTKVGLHELIGQSVQARVLGHRRGPKIDVIRYKPKKRVRVHRGARADLTALEILGIGSAQPAKAEKPARTRASKKQAPEPAEQPAEDS